MMCFNSVLQGDDEQRCANDKRVERQYLEVLCGIAKQRTRDKSLIAEFTANALQSKNPFVVDNVKLEATIVADIEWRKNVTNKEATAFREQAMQNIEQMGSELRRNGEVNKWFANVDPAIQKVECEFGAFVNYVCIKHV